MRVALDTNVLAYAEGINGAERRAFTVEILSRVGTDVVIPAQVLAELFRLLVSRAGLPASEAGDRILSWADSAEVPPTTVEAILEAATLVDRHQLSPFDAVILCVAAQAGCRLVLSEDLQDGFTWRGTTVVNPYAEPGHWLLASLLARTEP